MAQSRIPPPFFRTCPKWLDTVGTVGILASDTVGTLAAKTRSQLAAKTLVARRRNEQGKGVVHFRVGIYVLQGGRQAASGRELLR